MRIKKYSYLRPPLKNANAHLMMYLEKLKKIYITQTTIEKCPSYDASGKSKKKKKRIYIP